MLRGKHIVIGVTGGIAAYKAVYLLRHLQEEGAEVRVTMTAAATRFVGAETFAALTRHEVPIRIFPDSTDNISDNWTRHIQWAEWADMIVVAPCTANSLAKIVHGLSDSMLMATILAARCPVLVCPTMDGEMYQAPATRANLQQAQELGFHMMEPESGYLASGLQGPGRLPEPEIITGQIRSILESSEQQPPDQPSTLLQGKRILVTCGATREFLDPVRFLSNPSTGKMGMAMAIAAASFGAEVTLLHADSVDTGRLPGSIELISFTTSDDLFNHVRSRADADVIIMTAAVSDFRPAQRHKQKVKKESAKLELPLERTPDILQWLGDRRSGRPGEQILVGFAMETEDLAGRAREKRIRKGVDWMAGNDLSDDNSGFAVDTNSVLLIGPHSENRFKGTKVDVARSVLQHIFVS